MAIASEVGKLREWPARLHWKESQGSFATGVLPQLALAGATSSGRSATPGEASDAATMAASERLRARGGPHATWSGSYQRCGPCGELSTVRNARLSSPIPSEFGVQPRHGCAGPFSYQTCATRLTSYSDAYFQW